MLLYLVQHGEARKEDEDPLRGLTDSGCKSVSLVALYAREHGVHVTRIYHSGKKRAMQTAQLFSDHLKPAMGIVATDYLGPMDDPGMWSARLAEMHEDIMLVGHLPFLARLAGQLLSGDKERMFIDFKMGGIVCVQRSDDGHWTIKWMVVPEIVA